MRTIDLSLVCNNCGEAIEPGEAGEPIHPDSGDSVCRYSSFYRRMVATPVAPKKYTVIMNDGFPGRGGLPERPWTGNQAASLAEAKRMFRVWLSDSGNDYYRAPGYAQPGAEVILTANWDGFGYGDYPWTCLLVRGVRGGVVVEDV